MSDGRLNPHTRAAAIQRLRSGSVDVLVVGGGITGSGIALDAAARGLQVGLIERTDIAAGTSSRSSKLIHGGLRYLEMLDFGLVREALTERRLLLTRIAPHLVRPVPFLFPLHRRMVERVYMGAGLLLYDSMGGARHLPRTRHLSRRATLAAAPTLRPDGVVGAVHFHDGQEDDALYAVYTARTAAARGAVIATGVEAVEVLRDESGRVAGVEVVDHESGDRFPVRAARTIAAVGPATDWLLGAAGVAGEPVLRPSKGVHALIPRDRIPMQSGLFMRTEKSIFHAIPWGPDHWLLGDTDTEWDPSLGDTPLANREDVAYLLAKVNSALLRPVRPRDVLGVFAGLRPLVTAPGAADTTRLSRAHRIFQPLPGLTAIAGGKYTTYRVMARDAVDAALHELGGGYPASPTARLPLVGAEDAFAAPVEGLGVARLDRLVARHGACAGEVLGLAAADPALLAPIPGAEAYLLAEAVHACTHQGARSVEDVLARRLRASIETADRGRSAARAVAPLVGSALGWSDGRTADELAAYVRLRDAEQAAERAAADSEAVAAYRAVMAGAAVS
jgi:glycerol-3-phosphate dehydrogenase